MGEFTVSEHFAAERWRVNLGLSRPALAELTGYSVRTIANMERGVNVATGEKVKDREMARYRMVCAAVLAGLSFDWDELRVNPRPLMEAVDSCKTVMKRYA